MLIFLFHRPLLLLSLVLFLGSHDFHLLEFSDLLSLHLEILLLANLFDLGRPHVLVLLDQLLFELQELSFDLFLTVFGNLLNYAEATFGHVYFGRSSSKRPRAQRIQSVQLRMCVLRFLRGRVQVLNTGIKPIEVRQPRDWHRRFSG